MNAERRESLRSALLATALVLFAVCALAMLGYLATGQVSTPLTSALCGLFIVLLMLALATVTMSRQARTQQADQQHAPTVTDLGLLAYTAPANPVAYHQGALPEGTRYLRPYAVLMLTRAGYYALRFEVRDAAGVPVLVDDFRRRLNARESLVVTDQWLKHDEGHDIARWTLELHVDGTLLTVHDFRQDEGGGSLRAHLTGDGELSDELVAALEDGGALSLDELLER